MYLCVSDSGLVPRPAFSRSISVTDERSLKKMGVTTAAVPDPSHVTHSPIRLNSTPEWRLSLFLSLALTHTPCTVQTQLKYSVNIHQSHVMSSLKYEHTHMQTATWSNRHRFLGKCFVAFWSRVWYQYLLLLFCLKLPVLAQGKSTSLLFLYDFKKKNCEL